MKELPAWFRGKAATLAFMDGSRVEGDILEVNDEYIVAHTANKWDERNVVLYFLHAIAAIAPKEVDGRILNL